MANEAKHDWPMVRLGDVCHIEMGQAPKSEFTNERGEGFPLIAGAGDFTSTGLSAKKYTSRPTKIAEPGDLVISIRATIGPFRTTNAQCVLGRGVAGLCAENGLEAKFLPHLLTFLTPALQKKGKGATFLQVSKRDISELEFRLPPLDEQRRIAAILDEAKGQIDKFEGAGALLSSMTSNWLSLRSQGISRVKLSELGTFRGGMTPSKKNSEYWGGDVFWFTTKDLKFAEVYESKDRLTYRAIDETSASLIGKPSIAFSLRGMSLAHRLPMSCIPGEVTVNQDLKAFVPNQSTDRDVIFHLIKLKEKELLSKVSTSAHGTKKLDFRHLKELEIPDPSGEFGTRVLQVLEQVRGMMEQIRRRQEASVNLFQALSTRAFQGEL